MAGPVLAGVADLSTPTDEPLVPAPGWPVCSAESVSKLKMSSSEKPRSSLGICTRALQAGHSPTRPAKLSSTFSTCPFGQVKRIDIAGPSGYPASPLDRGLDAAIAPTLCPLVCFLRFQSAVFLFWEGGLPGCASGRRSVWRCDALAASPENHYLSYHNGTSLASAIAQAPPRRRAATAPSAAPPPPTANPPAHFYNATASASARSRSPLTARAVATTSWPTHRQSPGTSTGTYWLAVPSNTAGVQALSKFASVGSA